MSHFSYAELLNISEGSAWTPEKPFSSARVWTDTRTLRAGDFFLPLRGEHFDGHDYLPQAFRTGAAGAFVQRESAQEKPEWRDYPNLIAVPDPLAAYLALGRFHREKINPRTIAVTGSSGKTTTKDMVHAMLSPLLRTMRTEKNFNNEVGVSQTLLSIQPDTQALVVEMGMRGPGEIAVLSRAAKPDAAIVTNIGPAHIGRLGSLRNIALAKLEIVEGMDPAQGLLIVNGDDPLLNELSSEVWSGRMERYHLREAEDIRPWTGSEGGIGDSAGVQFRWRGVEFRLNVPGEHMVSNALGALYLGVSLGFEPEVLAEGLAAFYPEKGRWECFPLKGFPGVSVVNDAYNANPDSMKASLQAFLSTARPGRKLILLLGGMKELGDFSLDYHHDLGRWLAEQPHVSALFTVGEEGGWIADATRERAGFPVFAARDAADVAEILAREEALLENAVLYLKGSRAYNLDEIPVALTRFASTRKGDAPLCS